MLPAPAAPQRGPQANETQGRSGNATLTLAAPVPLGAVLRRMVEAVRTRRQLAAMDDRMLADLAISRAEALREARRAPWDTAPASRRPA